MLTIEFENNKYLIQENESVLNTLLRNNVLIPYSCQSGICQSCLMKVQEGALPSDSQKGLSEEYCEEKNFLACICKPTENLKIERASNSAQILNASVKAIELKSDEILILKLKCDEDFNYKPGQFINIINENNLSRSYSLASHPNTTSLLEFHIRRCSMGKMSNWIFESLKLNDKIKIAGPNGYCFYSEKYKNKPLLLIGVGTGLSPLVGILQDAFYKSHAGEIHLVHGALNNKGLYYRKELLSYKEINNKFFFHPCVLKEEVDFDNNTIVSSVQNYIEEKFSDLSGWEIFVCGNEEFVRDMEQQAFLQGADLNSIHSDAFVTAKS